MSPSKPDHASHATMPAQLQRAKASQRRLHTWLATALFGAVIFVAVIIVFFNATNFRVQPEIARSSATFKLVDGLGFAIGNVIYTLQGQADIEISAFGFKPLRKTLQSSELGKTLDIELSEQHQDLHITTSAASEKTRWFLQTQMLQTATALQHKLLSGHYNIGIDHPYYQKKDISIDMVLGQALQQHIQLDQINGSLSIRSQPEGARIVINGQAHGISPSTTELSGGIYHIEIKHPDYQSIFEDIEITNSKSSITRDYRLQAKPAYVQLKLSPAKGILLLNGKHITLPIKKLAILANINNTMTYFKDGYTAQQQHIKLAAEEESSISFQLQAEIGIVHIQSKPRASVFIDGKLVGQSPLKLSLSALPHQIRIEKSGYRSFQQQISPSSHAIRNITVSLRSQRQASLEENPAEWNNSGGILLQRFLPNDVFTMGAPRHEKGQRANEFLRHIKLSRPFYISKHEITTAQFSRQRTTNSSNTTAVSSISWIEAAKYCNWLSLQEHFKPFYNIRHNQLAGFNASSHGYRLPTEAEWEWLARKALKKKTSKFTWGDSTTIPAKSGNIADEYANGSTSQYVANYSDGYAGIAPVGSFPVESMGLFDLTGNVSEWVHDVYQLLPPLTHSTEIDPLGSQLGSMHTVKGSSWRSGSITELRASYRQGAKSGRDDIGFRIARYID